ncbi:hypothetical protein NVP1121O_055 [Vibrio phage 1.121.O._10N.286.46.C4]|nr:hypothetical protein NVP1121O_055 [Vibrio phage 1.121.O._10N.286.46.C4]
MAIKLILDTDKYNQYFPLILEGVEYIFHLYWNDAFRKRGFSQSGWKLSVYRSDLFDWNNLSKDQDLEALIQGGMKIMPNKDIFAQAYTTELPTGALYCYDTQSEMVKELGEQVTKDNLGTNLRYQLYYFTRQEIEAAGG